MKVKQFFNENFFTVVYAAISALMVWQFVTTEEGRANLYETIVLGATRESMFLVTVFMLIKMLNGIDKDLKQDLFGTPGNSVAFIIALVIGSAWMLR